MKTFLQYIQEDFNSDSGFQFTQKVINYDGSIQYLPIFFEKLPQRPFNLPRYLKSFDTDAAKETLDLKRCIRGIVFAISSQYLIFIFSSYSLHISVAKALDSSAKHPRVPKNKYAKIYQDTDSLSLKPEVPNQWCFPFIYEWNGDIICNLGDNATRKLFKEKDLKTEFKLNTEHSVVRSLP